MASSTNSSYPLDRRQPSAVRTSSNPSTSTPLGGPTSPHTPQRPISSSIHSSPSLYRSEEDQVIFEFGSRCLRVGLAGEPSPRATIHFGPSGFRRVGDFREHLPDYVPPDPTRKSTKEWGKDYELWQLDTRDEDVALVGDKIERAIRDAYNLYLLTDPKTKKVAVVLPTTLPSSYIEIILGILYKDFQVPGVSLLSSAVTAVTGGGMRSGLVVDIGWSETVVTAVYELREVQSRHSRRAVKLASLHMGRLLSKHGREAFSGDLEEAMGPDGEDERLKVSFLEAEETLIRAAWCQNIIEVLEKRRDSRPGAGGRQISGSWPADVTAESSPSQDTSHSSPRRPEDIPMNSFCLPIESALLANGKTFRQLDEDEYPLPILLYQTMVALPPDVRGTCISRIIFTGGGSNIPGLKARVLDEFSELVDQHGFDPVQGVAADKHRAKLAQQAMERRKIAQEEASRTRYPPNSAGLPAGETPSPIPAGMVMPERHPIDEKLARDASKSGATKGVTGIIRSIDTLGPWAGASLVISSRVKALVDVNAEDFNAHGLLSAVTAKTAEISVGRARSFTGREAKGWTLGLWATSLAS